MRKDDNLKFSNEDVKSYLCIFHELKQYLQRAKCDAQIKAIQNLEELLQKQDYALFVKALNGVDIWGGAGAVWEVYIENKNDERNFEMGMVNLIDLMEKTNVMGGGISPIRKIFKKNLSK